MKNDIKGWEGLPIELDDVDWLLANQSFRSQLLARKTIWSFVVQNQPVPQELKPILLSILSSDYNGKGKQVTKQFWDLITIEIKNMVEDKEMSVTDAISEVAEKQMLAEKTVNQEYYSPRRKALRANQDKSPFSPK
jgi:hypothetical protein